MNEFSGLLLFDTDKLGEILAGTRLGPEEEDSVEEEFRFRAVAPVRPLKVESSAPELSPFWLPESSGLLSSVLLLLLLLILLIGLHELRLERRDFVCSKSEDMDESEPDGSYNLRSFMVSRITISSEFDEMDDSEFSLGPSQRISTNRESGLHRSFSATWVLEVGSESKNSLASISLSRTSYGGGVGGYHSSSSSSGMVPCLAKICDK